jgi:hypothetical protein
MKLINLTHKRINIVDSEGVLVCSLPPENLAASVEIEKVVLGQVNGVDIVTYEYSNPEGIPDPVDGVMYVVGFAVLQALHGSRPDVVSPDTNPGSVIRASGVVLGVQNFWRT